MDAHSDGSFVARPTYRDSVNRLIGLCTVILVLALPRFSLAQPQDLGPIDPIERRAIDDQATKDPKSGEDANGRSSKKSSDNFPSLAQSVEDALLGNVRSNDKLPESRKSRATSPSADAVLGEEAKSRETTDAGNLLGKSLSVRGVSSQQRTPIVTDTRIRGERVGQVLASGSFWSPVRMDLDTMMNKIDSRLIDSLIVIKGPYSSRYGPGFSFIDIDLLMTPRYENGFEFHGVSSLDYQSNGDQWYGRQTFQGGDERWGFRASYGHRTGSDYTTGDGFTIPSSYKSGDLDIALGWNLTPDDRFEFNYLRLDQSDVEFPGLVYDMRYLVTDGYELKYFGTNPGISDFLFGEVWYNRTRFAGDTFALSKRTQIPQIQQILFSPSGNDGGAITDGDGSSMGYRVESIYGEVGIDHWALGTDLNLQQQELNDIEIFMPLDDNNFPLPRSNSDDVGLFVERITTPFDFLRLNAGARVDVINTRSVDFVPGVELPLSDIKDSGLDQSFVLWSTYITSETMLTDYWTGTSGFGFAQRPPTLTELYVEDAFIGSLQRGLTFLNGDPQLAPEQIKQFDLGLRGDYGRVQVGCNGFFAWIEDFITYDLTTPADPDGGLTQGASFVNTDLAVLRGIDSYARYDWLEDITLFTTLSYIEGDDKAREKPSRQTSAPRSGVAGVNREPLPGIAPLESRAGILWHDPSPRRLWGIEFSARMVARQDRIAATLQEIETPGFATMDIRSYKRIRDRWLLTGGVENLADRFYREHLDYRSGFGVFRPGVNFYTGIELTY